MDCREITNTCRWPGLSANRQERYNGIQPGLANAAFGTAFLQMAGECCSDTGPSWSCLGQDKLAAFIVSEKTMQPQHVRTAPRSPRRGPCSYAAAGARERRQTKCTPLLGCGLYPAQSTLQLCCRRLKGTPSDRSCRPLLGCGPEILRSVSCSYVAAGSTERLRTRCTSLCGGTC
eukprot:jgi/Botrbrau1/14515/Bobra.0223s0005.1